MKNLLVLIFVLFSQTTFANSSLPTRIRCEGAAPYKRYANSENGIYGRIMNRMYDLNFDHSSNKFTANLLMVVQTHCCGVPVPEFAEFSGNFKNTSEGNGFVSVTEGINSIRFEINLLEKTCKFRFDDGTKSMDGELTVAY